MNELAEVISKAIKGNQQTGSDYTARVVKVEGSTAYVQITGSDIADTPVAMSVSCKPGDMVRVRVANGRAWITGNDTLPPSNDGEAISARMLKDMSDRDKDIVIDFGTMRFVGNTLIVDSENFKLDKNGNAKFSGTLHAAGGTFKGELRFTGDYSAYGIGTQTVIISPDGQTPVGILAELADMVTAESRLGATQLHMTYDDWRGSSPAGSVTNIEAGTAEYKDRYNSFRATTVSKDNIRVRLNSNWTDYNSTGAHSSSDRRLKEDITGINPETARRLLPVQYRYKGDDKLHYGFIAQDVQKVIPEVVSSNEDGYLMLNYQELIAPLYALVLEQEKRIAQLEERLQRLEGNK